MPQRAHFTISPLQLTRSPFAMEIYQEVELDPCVPTVDLDIDAFLTNSEFFAFLKLGIPGDDASFVPSNSEFLALLDLVIPSNDAPLEQITSYEHPSLDFSRRSRLSPLLPPQQVVDLGACMDSCSSMTSFLRPDPALDVPTSPAVATPELFQITHGRCGGGRRCIAFGCTNEAQTRGLCKRHGGRARCRVPKCNKSSQSGRLCRTQRSGELCIAPGCKKSAQRHGKCATHSSR